MAVNVPKSLIKGFYDGPLCLLSPYCPHFQKETGQMNQWRDEAKSHLKREPKHHLKGFFFLQPGNTKVLNNGFYLMYKDLLNINKDNYNL